MAFSISTGNIHVFCQWKNKHSLLCVEMSMDVTRIKYDCKINMIVVPRHVMQECRLLPHIFINTVCGNSCDLLLHTHIHDTQRWFCLACTRTHTHPHTLADRM